MILVDTSPLVALLDSRQGKTHTACVRVIEQITDPMITTEACLTEAMYLIGQLRGWPGQKALWQLWARNILLIHNANPDERKRMQALMEKYKDTPMDFADASLVAAAESLELSRIFTLDSDFYVYRINDKDAFEVVP